MRSDITDFAVIVEDESEIFTDKLVALALRSYVKGRDIWDTWFLAHERRVKMPEASTVVAKAADYGTTPAELPGKIQNSKMRIEASGLSALDAEMKRFLPTRLYDAMAPAFPELNADVLNIMETLLTHLEAMS